MLFLNVKISNPTQDQVLQTMEDWLFGKSFHYVTTPNPEMIVDAQENDEFRNILNNSDMALPDGFGLVLWSKALGLPKINRISGSDITWDVLRLAKKHNKSVFLLGGIGNTAEKAAKVIEQQLPGIRMVGAESGGKLAKINGQWQIDPGLIDKINQFFPDILLIGRGHPHQEYFMWDFRSDLKSVKLAMGIGGTFDFICGNIQRAPKIMRRLGVEWLWRLIKEPGRRLPRIYKAVIKFSFLVLKNKFMFWKKNKVVVRFAPSPTGYLHIGGLRTALYNWMLAKKHNGQFILRLEDTDQTRYVPDSEKDIVESLKWIGIIPDQGLYLNQSGEIGEKGNNGPYRQSNRLDIYQKFARELLEKDCAYYCFCDEDRLRTMREKQIAQNQPPKYDGHCRNLTPETIKHNLDKKLPHVIRLKVPQNGSTEFEDEIRGHVIFNNSEIDDQILIKSDGFPTYHLANVVDDHLMGVNYVLRGEEWLPSTPKHVIIYNALGWHLPKFAHMSLLLNPDRSKLSKRSGDVAVRDYRKEGYLPEAIINFIAILGWNPCGDKEIYNLKEIIQSFNIADINKSGAIFNRKKLDWLNNHYIRQKDIMELTQLCVPYLLQAGYVAPEQVKHQIVWLSKVIELFSERMEKLSELPELSGFIFEKMLKYNKEMLIWKNMNLSEVRTNLENLISLMQGIDEQAFIAQNLEQTIKQWINENSLENGKVLWPTRVALSGKEKSPPPFNIAEVLGKDKTLERLRNAIQLIS